MAIGDLAGFYKGESTWHDSAGNTGAYSVEQCIEITAQGLELRQIHTHDGIPQQGLFVMNSIAEPVCRIRVDDNLEGFGAVFDDRFRLYFTK